MTDKPVKLLYDNFILVRLLAALLVLTIHFQVVTGGHLFDGKFFVRLPHFAIGTFFVISGYVILASFDKLPVVLSFYAKRFFRMYPLYALVVILQTILMSLFFLDDFPSVIYSIFRYFVLNMLLLNFLQYDVGGLLSQAHNPGINPSLWTIKVEVMFYMVVPIIYILLKRFGFISIIAIHILSTVYSYFLIKHGYIELAKQMPGELRYIIIGSGFYYYRQKIADISPLITAVIFGLSIALILGFSEEQLYFIHPFVTGLIVIILATRIPLKWIKTDLSYGVFLIHAPLLQFSILLGFFHDTYWFYALIVITACGLAYLSYHFIEAPAVTLGHKLSKFIAMRTSPRGRDSRIVAGK